MKTTLIIILILAVAGISTAIYRSNGNSITEISVLRDVTEKHLSQPKANEIIPLYNFTNQKWNGGIFHFANISNVSFTPSKETSIGTANQWLSNEYDRTKEVKRFGTDISKIINDSENDSVGRKNSSVYLPIANELNRLSKSKSSRRILLVYSDLMENDLNYSFYNDATLNQLNSNYTLATKKFYEIMSLQNLNGIEVYLLYEPRDAESDWKYKIVSDFYRKLLESKGANVTISANLN